MTASPPTSCGTAKRRVSPYIIPSEQGDVIFDDTVLDKRYSFNIELVRRQYSGNAHGVIQGIGVVTCVYVTSPQVRPILDYRLPDLRPRTQLDPVREMLSLIVYHKRLPFEAVLMDSWNAAFDLMLHIEKLGKRYYCPLKENRLVDDSNGQTPYQRIDALMWTEPELQQGKRIKIKGFPKDHKVKPFRGCLLPDARIGS